MSIIIFIIVVVAAIVIFFLSQAMKGSAVNQPSRHLQSVPRSRLSASPKKTGVSASEIKKRTEPIIQHFRKDSLAFFVYQEALSANLSVANIENLMKEYGSYSIRPSLIAYFSNDRELLLSFDSLASFITSYLREHGVESSESDWESSLEKYIWKTTQEEAVRIVSRIKPVK